LDFLFPKTKNCEKEIVHHVISEEQQNVRESSKNYKVLAWAEENPSAFDHQLTCHPLG